MSKIIVSVLFVCLSVFAAEGTPIFSSNENLLLMEESRQQFFLLEPATGKILWRHTSDCKVWDSQLLSDDRLLVTFFDGFGEYCLKTGAELSRKRGYRNSYSCRQFQDGRRVMSMPADGKDAGWQLLLFDSAGQELKCLPLPYIKKSRMIRLTDDDTVLIGDSTNLYEIDLAGNVLHKISVPGARYVYSFCKNHDGTYWVSNGYGTRVLQLRTDGTILKEFGGDISLKPHNPHFFGNFQWLENGHLLVANWQGHKPEDSTKGTGLLELNAKGECIWSYNNPAEHGSLHSVMLVPPQSVLK